LIVASEDGKIHDRFRNKLMFPISDARGRITGFGARVLDDSLPKYVNSPQTPVFDKSGTLYGINFASSAIRQQNLAVIVEGYMDVITAHQNGFSNVIASMGTSITYKEEDKDPWRTYNEPAAREARRFGVERSTEVSEKQVNTLKRLTRNIILALDADSAGEEAMRRCVDFENSLDAEVKVVILPEGQDPDDVIKGDTESWQQLIDKALPVIDYTIQTVSSKQDMSKARDKSAAVDTLLPLIAQTRDIIRQGHYVSKLSNVTGINITTLKAALNDFILKNKKLKSTLKEKPNNKKGTFFTNVIEEQCLALLLKHPELRSVDAGLKPEYFENSENREIFIAWQQADDVSSLKENLDTVLWDYLDTLVNKDILVTRLEERYNKYVLRLHEEYLRGLERKRAVTFTLEAEVGGTAAELAKLEEQGIEPSKQLREIFDKKAGRGGESLP
jgi:DNA primase